MKTVAIAVGALVLLGAAMSYNVWRASQEPVVRTPGLLETGRTKLHQQLEEAKRTEAQVEKQNWDSPPALRTLIAGHEQRIKKLKENTEAAEILAYDKESIQRLEKRIADLAAEAAAKAAEAADESRAQPTRDSQANPAVLSKADSAAKSNPEPPTESKPKPAVQSKPKPPQDSQP
jgi:hypothetical protein